ncbi:radical SAM/SPASM domain-containing protein [Streptomyces sp. NPDC020379]|uniref:radical SAM/SPASM domain-containing protein n=1 Tax=Streptomyces sp. NPDC020379 TaxID=3365071 RepID=UPI0037903192
MLTEQTIMVANGCNLSCTYCWYEVGSSQYLDATLSPEHYQGWFAACAAEGRLSSISITGGEPLLRTDIGELVDVAGAYADHVALFTNGTLLTLDLAARLAEAGCEVHVSLDHVSGGIADKVRGGTRASLRSLDLLASAGASTVQVCVVMTSRNWRDVEHIAARVAERGFTLELIPVGVPHTHPLSLMTLATGEREQLRALLERISTQLDRPLYYGRLGRYLASGVLPRIGSCHAGESGVFINADGDIQICAQRNATSLGNIRSSTPADVLAAKRTELALRPAGPCASLDCLVLT